MAFTKKAALFVRLNLLKSCQRLMNNFYIFLQGTDGFRFLGLVHFKYWMKVG